MYAHVLVGTDGSPTAAEAVRHAARLAQASRARLTVMSVYSDARPAPGDHVPADLAWSVTPAAQAEEAVRAGAALARDLGVDATHQVVKSPEPAEAILKAAESSGVDLIVIGSRGLSSPSRFILGNVPNDVSHHARCDVAIVHTA